MIPVINRRVAALRSILGEPFDRVPDHQLDLVIDRAGRDVDLAATALTMTPRPDWVTLLIGRVGAQTPTPHRQ